MRIDDENKVVWLTDTNDLAFVCGKNNLDIVSELIKFDGSYDLCSLQNDYFNGKHFTKHSILLAILNNYRFKLEEQKYYWRKKKKHLAWFEDEKYLNFSDFSMECHLSSRSDLNGVNGLGRSFTSQEARDLLKDDFDKFEKVECE